jgi:hypothetical protein
MRLPGTILGVWPSNLRRRPSNKLNFKFQKLFVFGTKIIFLVDDTREKSKHSNQKTQQQRTNDTAFVFVHSRPVLHTIHTSSSSLSLSLLYSFTLTKNREEKMVQAVSSSADDAGSRQDENE